MEKLNIEELKVKYRRKMLKALNIYDEEVGHYDCDCVLVALLKELGFDEVVEIWESQDKWYA